MLLDLEEWVGAKASPQVAGKMGKNALETRSRDMLSAVTSVPQPIT